ncbi:MAG: DUF4430 domain-containing protein [Candidatus Aenigmatarchaeota archaeon]
MNDPQRFPLLEEATALYESDIGTVDFLANPAIPPRQEKRATGKTRISENVRSSIDEEMKDTTKRIPAKGRYEEDEISDESYTSEFGLQISGTYFDEKEQSVKIEYKLLSEKDVRKAAAMDGAALHEMEPPASQRNESLMQAGAAEQAAHPGILPIERYAENVLGSELKATYDAGVLNIEYKETELINGQKTYQRVVLAAEKNGESVYELTMRRLSGAGIDVSAEYESDFESMLLTSINGKIEGAEGNFNEFYLNGEIGTNAVDKQKLKKGDIVEWRYAEETDGSCGGSPDFSAVKSILEYSAVARSQAEYFGILSAGPYPTSPSAFGRGLILH